MKSTLKTRSPRLRFALAFWSLRFGSAFWFCVLLIEDISCVLPNEEPVLGYLKFSAKGTKRDVFGKPILGNLITADIQGEPYYQEYLEKVAKHQRYLADEQGSDPDSPAPKPTKATKKSKLPGLVSKQRKPISSLRLVDESVAKGIPEKEPRVDDEEDDVQRALEESLKSIYDAPRGPLPPVVIREPESGKYQLLPEVHGKGKKKVTNEQVARDLLTLQTPKKKNHGLMREFQMKTRLDQTLVIKMKAGSNPDEQDEGQAGPNPSDAAASQPLPSPVVYTRPNLKHMDLEVTDVSTQAQPKQMDEGFTATAYLKVQENLKLTVEEQLILEEPASSTGTLSSLQHLTKDLSFGDLFFNDKPSEADNEKTTVETEGESMVFVTIQQDTSLIPPMKTPIIDLTLRPKSLNVHKLLQATTTKTTTTIHPPPSQPQQRTTDSMLMKRIGELKHIMANLIQDNKHLEERLDSHGARLYTLENLDIPQQVRKAVDKVVTDVVDWAIQAPLWNQYRDLPEVDMKEILYQRIIKRDMINQKRHLGLHLISHLLLHYQQVHLELQDLLKLLDDHKCRHYLLHLHPPPKKTQAEYKDLKMDDDIAPDAEAQSSDDEDIDNAHIPKNNWASALASTYLPPLEDSLLAQTSDMTMFMEWFCKRQGITELKPQDLEGPAFELVNHPNVIHLQYQMEEFYKLLTDNMDDSIIKHNVSKPLPLGGLPGHLLLVVREILLLLVFPKGCDMLALVELFIPVEGNTGKRNAITVDINTIALLRQTTRSSPGRNDGTTKPESEMDVDIVVDDEVLHKLIVQNIRTDNGIEFVNQTLRAYYEDVRISHQTFVAHSPQQNNVVERQNCTLVEAARTMLIFSKALLFLWAETVVTACYTQNQSLIRKCHNKNPYELLHNRKPDLSYLHVFGALCYPTNDYEDLGKLKPKADIKIFVAYAPAKKAYQIYNKRTRLIIETIHVINLLRADHGCSFRLSLDGILKLMAALEISISMGYFLYHIFRNHKMKIFNDKEQISCYEI
uniref:Retrovirus-related Pol polyprotein from transposon TNT 1-94 n=1 Tax=Tanacetum cinerariifolium TaxID=118510 RepID=A0A6L2N3B7_TANCI|nr:retrovirus-related Pol polyprotein from transposon TNT 1-94 [Tanacetum cinerariifolium]